MNMLNKEMKIFASFDASEKNAFIEQVKNYGKFSLQWHFRGEWSEITSDSLTNNDDFYPSRAYRLKLKESDVAKPLSSCAMCYENANNAQKYSDTAESLNKSIELCNDKDIEINRLNKLLYKIQQLTGE